MMSPSKPPKPSRSSKPLSQIPSIKQLCELLGFQHASVKDTNAFMEDTRAWRKSHEAKSGRDVSQMLRWNNDSDQLVLEEMAQTFIDHEVYRERFWSKRRSWNHDSDLQLPEDRAEIIALLKELFWKQNRYAYNNSQYGGSNKTELRDASIENSPSMLGAAEHRSQPVALEQATLTTEKVPELVKDHTPTISPRLPAVQLPKTVGINLAHDSTESSPGEQCDDIYEVPDDSDYEPSRSLKRRRIDTTPGKQSRKVKKYSLLKVPRRIERTRRTRITHDNVPDDQAVQLVEEQEAESCTPFEDPGQVSPRRLFAAPVAPMGISMSPRSTSPLQTSAKTSSPARSETPTQARIEAHDVVKPADPATYERRQLQASITRPNSQLLLGLKRVFSSPEPGDGLSSSKQLPSSSADGIIATRSTSLHMDAQKMPILSPKDSRITESPSFQAQQNPELTNAGNPLHIQKEINFSKPTSINISDLSEQPQSALLTHPRDSTLEPSRQPNTRESWNKDNSTEEYPAPQPRTEIKQRDSPPRSSSSKPRTKTLVSLWIITREPRYTEEQWDEGKFQGTPLSTFIEGISMVTQRGHIDKIKLTLRTPTTDTKITVFKDAEDSWESAKETFAEKLRESRAEARAKRHNESLSFKILIEPFYEEGSFPTGSIDEDEDEIDF